jgi:hypothetical protein
MARPLSLYEQHTEPTLPPPERLSRAVLVTKGMNIISLANGVYGFTEYNEDGWREILLANGIENPFLLDAPPELGGKLGQTIIIPALTLPDFEEI